MASRSTEPSSEFLFEEGRVRVLNGKGRKQRWTALPSTVQAVRYRGMRYNGSKILG